MKGASMTPWRALRTIGPSLAVLVLLSAMPSFSSQESTGAVYTSFNMPGLPLTASVRDASNCVATVSKNSLEVLTRSLEPGDTGGLQVICGLSTDGSLVMGEVRIMVKKDSNINTRLWELPKGPDRAIQ